MITQQQFNSLFRDDITKKEYDSIVHQIDERFEEICKKFVHKIKRSKAWYDYGNVSYEDGNSPAHFDPFLYKEYIEISGEWIEPPPGYDLAFPTRWLWEDSWEEEMNKTITSYKEQLKKKKQLAQQKQEERKQRVEMLKASIKGKLTPEEMKIIKFK